jgi:hypothetical protein
MDGNTIPDHREVKKVNELEIEVRKLELEVAVLTDIIIEMQKDKYLKR